MIDILRNRPGISISELAMHFGKSERSIYRWLREISTELRLPVRFEDGGYYLASEASDRAVSLTPEELLVLKLSLNSRLFGPGSPLRAHAVAAWAKIRDAAPGLNLDSMSELTSTHSIAVNAPPFEVEPEVAQLIREAIADHRRLRVVYRSQKSDRTKNYVIDPYAMVFRRHSWYVLALCRAREKVVQFRLGRFQSAKATGETFQPPLDFSADAYFRWSWEAWGGGEPTRVMVRFHPRVARMIEETQRHPSQIVRDEPDGSVIFEATVSSIEEFGSWVLGYGGFATVIEPKALRDYVVANIADAAANYSVTDANPDGHK
jgi:proteasome accessory factor B